MHDEPPFTGPCFNRYGCLDRQWLNILMPNGKASGAFDRVNWDCHHQAAYAHGPREPHPRT